MVCLNFDVVNPLRGSMCLLCQLGEELRSLIFPSLSFPPETRIVWGGRTRALCLNPPPGVPHQTRTAVHFLHPTPGHVSDNCALHPAHPELISTPSCTYSSSSCTYGWILTPKSPCTSFSATWLSVSSVTVSEMLWSIQTQHLSIPYEGHFSNLVFPYFFYMLAICFLKWWSMRGMCLSNIHCITPLWWGRSCMTYWCLGVASFLIYIPCCILPPVSSIPYHFCYFNEHLKLSCLNTPFNELVIFIEGVLTFLPLGTISGPYICTGATVLSVPPWRISTKFFMVLLHYRYLQLFISFISQIIPNLRLWLFQLCTQWWQPCWTPSSTA